MLQDWQTQLLEKPFEVHEHGFLSGNLFIKKTAIRRRLHKVDPSWSITAPVIVAETNDVVALSASLTISGVTRSATGTGLIVRYTKEKDKQTGVETLVERAPYDIARETAKALKTADSDLLPRCASKFGIGAYLRDMSKPERDSARDEAGLKKFLDELNRRLTPVHWTLNGGGERVAAEIKALKLEPAFILQNIEPGRVLTRLSETALTEYQFVLRLHQLAAEKAATPVTAGGSPDADPKGAPSK